MGTELLGLDEHPVLKREFQRSHGRHLAPRGGACLRGCLRECRDGYLRGLESNWARSEAPSKAVTKAGAMDRLFGVPATTRNWNPITAIANVLERNHRAARDTL